MVYEVKEGIKFDCVKIKKNFGLCILVKMMFNLMWGKFGQRINKMQV